MYFKRYHQSSCTNRNICLSPDNEHFLLCFLLEIFCNLIHNSSKIYFYVSISTFTICIKFILCHSCNDIILYVLVCVTIPLQMLIIFIHTILFNYNSLIHSWIIFQRLIYLSIHSFNHTVIYLFTPVRNTIESLLVSLLLSH